MGLNIVYSTPVRDIDDLRRRIHDAIALVSEEMLKNTFEMKRRLLFRAENGGRQSELPYFCHHFQNQNLYSK